MRRLVAYLSSRLLRFLHEHPIWAIGILFVIGMLLVLLNLSNLALRINENSALQYASLFVRSLEKFRTLYGADVVTRVQPLGILVTNDYRDHPGAIPIPSTLGIEISQQITEQASGTKARLYSDYPFPSRKDGGPHDAFETEALIRLRTSSDHSIPFYRFETVDGRLSLRLAQAVIMAQACVDCHDSRADSPKKDWKVGDVRGVQEVILPIDSAYNTIRQGLLATLGVMVLVTAAILGVLGFVLNALRASVRALSRMNAAYTRFVPHEFLSLLGKQSVMEVELANSVQMEMTVLFTDIRSFTSLSEGMDPERNFMFLSDFLSRMGPLVRENHGFIDRYFGDAIMALFQDPDDAVSASLALLKQLAEFNQTRVTQQLAPIGIGIGLNTGKLMLGTVGERDRMDGAVISDVVYMASRVEDLTKLYKVSILVTERTFRGLGDAERYRVRLLDRVQVEGKTAPVTLYEVFSGDPAELQEKKMAIKADFEQAVGLFQLRQFQRARQLFQQCLAKYPEDKASEFYIQRCDHHSKEGEDTVWDGSLDGPGMPPITPQSLLLPVTNFPDGWQAVPGGWDSDASEALHRATAVASRGYWSGANRKEPNGSACYDVGSYHTVSEAHRDYLNLASLASSESSDGRDPWPAIAEWNHISNADEYNLSAYIRSSTLGRQVTCDFVGRYGRYVARFSFSARPEDVGDEQIRRVLVAINDSLAPLKEMPKPS